MATYCKAYLLGDLRRFPGWVEPVRQEGSMEATGGADAGPQPFNEESVVFLHESYVVTEGAFSDENVVFDQVSPAWIDFCAGTLNFALPPELLSKPQAAGLGPSQE